MQPPLLEFAARTDVGAIRKVNEDSFLAQAPLFLVADGVGGHEAGDRASQAAIAAFADLAGKEVLTLQQLGAAYGNARSSVDQISANCARGAGTTLSGVFLTVQDGVFCWLVANVGDSRVYRYRGGVLQQITHDHTLRNEMIAGGADANDPNLPAGNVITRALGSGADLLDTWYLPVHPDDTLLICTDGLTDTVTDAEIRAGMSRSGVAEIADYLMDTALQLEPRDNVTLIVVRAGDSGQDAEATLNNTEEVYGAGS